MLLNMLRSRGFCQQPRSCVLPARKNAHCMTCLCKQELVVWVRGFRDQLIAVGATWWALCLRDRTRAR